MPNRCKAKAGPKQSLIYQIRIEGHLNHDWTAWFDGMIVTLEKNGETLLTGPIPDQSALFGLLRKVRDLGIPLVSVNREIDRQAEPPKPE